MRLRRLTGLEREELEARVPRPAQGDRAAPARSCRASARYSPRSAGKSARSRTSTATPRAPRSSDEAWASSASRTSSPTKTWSSPCPTPGYIKRLPVSTYRKQRRGGRGVTGMDTKDEDFVKDLFIASAHQYMLFFTNKGRVYWRKVHELPGRPHGPRPRHRQCARASTGTNTSPPACPSAT